MKEVISVVAVITVLLAWIVSILTKGADEAVAKAPAPQKVIPEVVQIESRDVSRLSRGNPTSASRSGEKCYPTEVDASFNTNENKPGTACYRQVAKVRKLEFDPMFDCSREIRKSWQREFEIAERMACKL